MAQYAPPAASGSALPSTSIVMDISCELFVTGLGPHASEADVTQRFGPYGQIVDIWVGSKKGHAPGQPADTFANIRFQTHLDAARAREALDGSPSSSGVVLQVQWAQNRRAVWVGSLSSGVTGEALAAAFTQFGAIDRAAVSADPATGASLGYGFVVFRDGAAADAAARRVGAGCFLVGGSARPVLCELARLPNDGPGFTDKSKAALGADEDLVEGSDPRARFAGPAEEDTALRFKELHTEYRMKKQALRAELREKEARLVARMGGTIIPEHQPIPPPQSAGLPYAPPPGAYAAPPWGAPPGGPPRPAYPSYAGYPPPGMAPPSGAAPPNPWSAPAPQHAHAVHAAMAAAHAASAAARPAPKGRGAAIPPPSYGKKRTAQGWRPDASASAAIAAAAAAVASATPTYKAAAAKVGMSSFQKGGDYNHEIASGADPDAAATASAGAARHPMNSAEAAAATPASGGAAGAGVPRTRAGIGAPQPDLPPALAAAMAGGSGEEGAEGAGGGDAAAAAPAAAPDAIPPPAS